MLIFASPDVGGVRAFKVTIKITIKIKIKSKIKVKIATTRRSNGPLRCLHRSRSTRAADNVSA